jgi:hypothetical protein
MITTVLLLSVFAVEVVVEEALELSLMKTVFTDCTEEFFVLVVSCECESDAFDFVFFAE